MLGAGQLAAPYITEPPPAAALNVPTALRSAVQQSAKRVDTQAPGPHEKALLTALGEALARRPDPGTRQPFTLDLSQLRPEALALFTEAVAQALDRPERHGHAQLTPVTVLKLPAGTSSLPTGLRGLPDLQELSYPDFAGRQLDLRGLSARRTVSESALRISTPGAAALREIQVDSARWAARQVCFDLHTRHVRKVTLVDSEHNRRPVPGRVYVREAIGRSEPDGKYAEKMFEERSRVNLNTQVTFQDSAERIVCRHLAVAHVMHMLEHRRLPTAPDGKTRQRLDYKAFSTPASLQAAMPKDLETRYQDFTRHSKDNHLVAVPRWDGFLRGQFRGMTPGQHQQFLVLSYNHAMHLELQVKPREGDVGDTDWVVAFYDPNCTATHQRTVLDPHHDRPCTLASLLPDERCMTAYFGNEPDQGIALVIRATDEDIGDHGLRSSDAKARLVRTDFAGELCSAEELLLRMEQGLDAGLIPRLRTTLRSGQVRSFKVLALLQAKSLDGIPALFLALQNGHAPAAKALLDAALRAATQELIDGPGPLALLQAKDENGTPALFMALQNGHADAAKALLGAALQAATQELINGPDLLALLQAKDGDGTPALFMALENGHAPAAQALIDAFTMAIDRSYISPEQLMDLLLPAGVKGRVLLSWALRTSHSGGALQLLADLTQWTARSPERITAPAQAQLERWLREAGRVLETELHATAPSSDLADRRSQRLLDSVGVWIQAIRDSPLPPPAKAALLREHMTGGDSLLTHLAAHPAHAAKHQDAVRELVAALLPPPTDSKRGSLAQGGEVAVQGLCRAFMAANLGDWVTALAQSLSASGPPPQARVKLLLDWDQLRATSALSMALERGNTLAVQAWMQAALALAPALDRQSRLTLLSGKPTGFLAGGWRVSAASADPATRVAWAQCIARAPEAQLPRAEKQDLLKAAGMDHLLPTAIHLPPAAQRNPRPGDRQPASR